MKYMVAIDGSATADAAFEMAMRIVRPKQDSLHIMSVAQQFPFEKPGIMKEVNDDAEKRARQHIREYAARSRENGIPCAMILGKGLNIGFLICDALARNNIDILIIGRRSSKTTLGKLLKAHSISNYCVEHAECHVLVIKDEHVEYSQPVIEPAEESPPEEKESSQGKCKK